MKGRMPAFPAYAEDLADGLASAHGLGAANTAQLEGPWKTPAANLAEIGLKLTLKEGGFDCRLCHALQGEVLDLQNKGQGIGLRYLSERLRHDYYARWMRDPLRIDPGTKMPRLSPDGRQTALKHTYDGQAEPQFNAIWHYLQSLNRGGMKVPNR